ncbi:MAG: hypothetical protein AMXMBFR7_52920 [Planctomycetota bacterium]
MIDQTLEVFALELIRRKARQLVGKAGITKQDVEDVAQDLYLDFWRGMRRCDASHACARHFVRKLVRHSISRVLRSRLAIKRGCGRIFRSQHAPERPFGQTVAERLATLPDPSNPDGRADERKAVITETLDRLDPNLRPLCEMLKVMSIAEAAAHLRMNRANLYRQVRRLRTAFAAAGLPEWQ